MSSLTTALVGRNVQTLAPAPPAGTAAGSVLVVNLDTANAVNLGSSATNLAYPLGPLASVTLTAPVYAAAATDPLLVGIAPGGSSYSPGSLTITGPVTAEITGPVTVEGTVDIGGTTDVEIQNANIDVQGVGGFINPGQVSNLFNTGAGSVGPGVNSTLIANIDVTNYASVVLAAENLTNGSAAAGAAVCAVFHLVWSDSIGDETATDTVSLLLGANANATWEVPIKGSFCTLQVENIGTAGTITVPAGNIIIDGSYRTVPNVRVLQGFVGSPLPTLAGCTVVLQGNPVFQIASWIASVQYAWSSAVSNVVFPLPQWAGEVAGFYQIITQALAKAGTIVDLTYALQGQVVSGGNYPFGVIVNIPAPIGNAALDFNLPPTQCALILATPATAGEFFLSLVGVGN